MICLFMSTTDKSNTPSYCIDTVSIVTGICLDCCIMRYLVTDLFLMLYMLVPSMSVLSS